MFRSPDIKLGLLALSMAFVALASACSRQPNSDTSATSSDSAAAKVTGPAQPAPSISESAQASVKIYIDPVTGVAREPTQAEIAAEAAVQKKNTAAKPQEMEAPREIVHPDGTVEVVPTRRSHEALVGCIDAHGEVKMDHRCEGNARRDAQ